MMQAVVRKFAGIAEAEASDREEYRRMTPEARLKMSLELRRAVLGEQDATEQRLDLLATLMYWSGPRPRTRSSRSHR
jgi:hypothetical protein